MKRDLRLGHQPMNLWRADGPKTEGSKACGGVRKLAALGVRSGIRRLQKECWSHVTTPHATGRFERSLLRRGCFSVHSAAILVGD